MSEGYDVQALEAKWQRVWDERGTYRIDESDPRPKFYDLCMYPYPSGPIHMGHVRNYTLGDVLCRYKTMQGFGVLSPMGWDSFGLPAENAAIAEGIHPGIITRQRIATMKAQIQRLGSAYDWRRELSCCEPDYYRWTRCLRPVRHRGGQTRPRAVDVPHHRLRRAAARRPRHGRLAGAGQDDAAQLDRPVRGRRVRHRRPRRRHEDPRLHHPHRHGLRHDVRGPG